jgi:hypothetical protein
MLRWKTSGGLHEPVELRLALALDTRGCTRLPCAAWFDAVMSSHFSDIVCPFCPPSHGGSERSLVVGRQQSRIGVYEVCISSATHLRLSVKAPIDAKPEICPPPLKSDCKGRYRCYDPCHRIPRSNNELDPALLPTANSQQ